MNLISNIIIILCKKIYINRIKAEILTLQRDKTKNYVRENTSYMAGKPLSTFHLNIRRKNRTVIKTMQNNDTIIENEAEINRFVNNNF